ncbi:MAG: branched-chain amino acid ABC transporter permease [Chloroflexota bacterium]|nr:branched-chain amino acid ABC transporter permease [Chloroflexota bacterium]
MAELDGLAAEVPGPTATLSPEGRTAGTEAGVLLEREEKRGWASRLQAGYAVMLALLIIFPFVNPSGYALTVLTEILVFGLFALSLDIIMGYTGLPSFGHAAFFGVGAYATAIFSAKLGIANLGVSLIVAVGLAALGAAAVGALAIRTSGVYFLMLTLAFAQMIYAAAEKWTFLTGGDNGMPGVHKPDLFVPGWTVAQPKPFYLFILAMFVICFFVVRRLIHSPFGRSLIGIRENEVRMRAMGYNTRVYKLVAFILAGGFAGVSGLMYAYYNNFVSPSDVYWTASGTVLLMVLFGGLGSLIGPVIGAATFLLLQNALSSTTDRWQLVLGLIFVVFILFVRRGIVGLYEQLRDAVFHGRSA